MPKWSEVKEIGIFTYVRSALSALQSACCRGWWINGRFRVLLLPLAVFPSILKNMARDHEKGLRLLNRKQFHVWWGFCSHAYVRYSGDPTTAVVLGVLIINGLHARTAPIGATGSSDRPDVCRFGRFSRSSHPVIAVLVRALLCEDHFFA